MRKEMRMKGMSRKEKMCWKEKGGRRCGVNGGGRMKGGEAEGDEEESGAEGK